jgi:hypothetical protein
VTPLDALTVAPWVSELEDDPVVAKEMVLPPAARPPWVRVNLRVVCALGLSWQVRWG